VRDQRPQLSMIDSAGKRDIILRPSLSLQPNRQSTRALCGLHGFDPQVLQRGPGDRPFFIGCSLRHAQHYVTETLSKHAHGLDRRCDLSCIRLVHVFRVSRLCKSSNFFVVLCGKFVKTRVARGTAIGKLSFHQQVKESLLTSLLVVRPSKPHRR
jgi:hypothetical protein